MEIEPGFYTTVRKDKRVPVLVYGDWVYCDGRATRPDLWNFSKFRPLLIARDDMHELGSVGHSGPPGVQGVPGGPPEGCLLVDDGEELPLEPDTEVTAEPEEVLFTRTPEFLELPLNSGFEEEIAAGIDKMANDADALMSEAKGRNGQIAVIRGLEDALIYLRDRAKRMAECIRKGEEINK